MYSISMYGGVIVKISKELLKGSTSILILSLLNRRSMYGYEMIREIEDRSENIFSFKEGTLYPLLHVLEKEKMIESYWEDTESKRKRKYYRITDTGRKLLSQKEKEWKIFTKAVEQVLWEGLIWA